jgi:hypothetical protein
MFLSPIWAYHGELNHPSPTVLLGLLQRSFPSGLLLLNTLGGGGVVSCSTETRDRSPLLLASTQAAGHVATLAESRNTFAFLSHGEDIPELLRMNDDVLWERSFQFRTLG